MDDSGIFGATMGYLYSETLEILMISVLWFWKEEEPYKEPYNYNSAARNSVSDGSNGSLFFAPRPGP